MYHVFTLSSKSMCESGGVCYGSQTAVFTERKVKIMMDGRSVDVISGKCS